MPQFERIQKSTKRRERETAASTFPEDYVSARPTGGEPDADELLEQIDRLLSEVTARALGRSTGIEAA